MNKRLLIILFTILNSFALAQNDHWWWYQIHQHDGVTPWQRYLVLSPAYFGPNAFPVPEINSGRITSNFEFENAVEGHFNKHEQTYNLLTKLNIPLIEDKVGIKLSIVPIEFFSHDTLIRDQRFSRNYNGKGSANGDLYITTLIQLLKDHTVWPDVLLGINIRTASGNNFDDARFADSPGYFFDISAGKKIVFKNKTIKAVRIYGMLGFYAWQTNLPDHFQDDALLYGSGIQIDANLLFTNELGGFYGYLNNGDRPLVYRSSIKTHRNKRLNYCFHFEHGINDYNFRSFRVSLIYSPHKAKIKE
ncbi:MAG: hypothetical protein V1783_02795 [Bacteroidota bacterium]